VGIAAVAGHYRQLRMRERAEKRHVEFLLRESTHRVKNCLAVTQGIARQIAKHVHDVHEFQDAFCERLQSLASSHDLLVKHAWQSVNIRDLAVDQLEAFGDPGNVKTEGEPIFINPAATEQLGLALYELGSNSMKYGALKQDGKVSITWRVLADSMLEFVWQESGAPAHKLGQNGFGHLVLTEIVPKTLRGRGILTDTTDGITYRLSMHPQYYRAVGIAA
jgi:two-component sensor histidine kinase